MNKAELIAAVAAKTGDTKTKVEESPGFHKLRCL